MFKVSFSGNLTADAELSDRVGCCNFTVAARTSVMEEGKPKVAFIRVSVWGKRGEACAKFLKKGDYVVGTGDLFLNEYVGRDGTTHTAINVNNADVEFTPRTNSPAAASTLPDNDDEQDIFVD